MEKIKVYSRNLVKKTTKFRIEEPMWRLALPATSVHSDVHSEFFLTKVKRFSEFYFTAKFSSFKLKMRFRMAGEDKISSRHFFVPLLIYLKKSSLLLLRQFQNSSKLSKRPLLRSDKGSVFLPSHKATAGQAPVTLQVAPSNYPLQFFANVIFAIF